MKYLALEVPAQAAERTRKLLLGAGKLRRDARIHREGDRVYLPVLSRFALAEENARFVQHAFPRAPPRRPRSYRDLLDLPKKLSALLPRSFDVVGEIVLVRIPEELEPHAIAIGEALLRFVPRARLVAEDRGVRGVERLRGIRVLAGSGGLATEHRENGLEFHVDLGGAYFSPRLGREHAGIAAQVMPGESVLDLCCGIGPFALTIACAGKAGAVTAVDVNPTAIRLLRRNAERLCPNFPVRSEAADAAAYLRGAPQFDRIILNLPHGGFAFLHAAGGHLRPGGVLHYFGIGPKRERVQRREALRDALGGRDRWRIVEEHRVHDYSPREELTAYAVVLSRAPE